MSEISEWCGKALIGEELIEQNVRIYVENGIIAQIEETDTAPDVWICPCLFNAHTHLGDTIAMDIPCTGSLTELVTPPNGLKHRLLEDAPRSTLISAIRSSVRYMLSSGTAGFADFREGGTEGVGAIHEAISDLPVSSVILGRNGGEELADGIGVSSVRDVSLSESQLRNIRDQGKILAFHAGEKDSADVEQALEFEPDLLVHCTHATDAQLSRCADMEIPIAVCPRSNWILGVAESSKQPPVKKMLDLGCTVLLGTDNVMFVQPDLFREMNFVSTIYNLPERDILEMSIRGSELFGMPFYLNEGNRANFFLIDPMRANIRFSHDLCKTIVNRMNSCFIKNNLLTNYQNKL